VVNGNSEVLFLLYDVPFCFDTFDTRYCAYQLNRDDHYIASGFDGRPIESMWMLETRHINWNDEI
jgi:hypothetical protein